MPLNYLNLALVGCYIYWYIYRSREDMRLRCDALRYAAFWDAVSSQMCDSEPGTCCLSVTLVISDMKGHEAREAEPHPEINFGRTGLCWVACT